ncbi:hypothetical protein EYC84_001050 [Monilinia fructicola]|uniref:Uncharacterized protein n=1 Tax=Monilinia fructicola TaxID=38448 RepID=A0A5M9JL95_MONFR|nr:hypothetical protein EYC84_001050 [Monilinia fructicola]
MILEDERIGTSNIGSFLSTLDELYFNSYRKYALRLSRVWYLADFVARFCHMRFRLSKELGKQEFCVSGF